MIRATTDADIILASPSPSPTRHPNAAAYYAETRFRAIRRLAEEYGCEYVDWWAEFASYRLQHPDVPLANGIVSSDNVHPSAFGYNLMRNVIYRRLSGINGQNDISPAVVTYQGKPRVVRLGEIGALGLPSDVEMPAGWSPVADVNSSGGFAARSGNTSPLSVGFEGNRIAIRVKGQTGGGLVSFQIDGQPVSALGLRRISTPVINPANWMTANNMSGASLRKPYRIEAVGSLVAESFTMTFTSDTAYSVSGSVSGVIGSGDINTDAVLPTPAGGNIVIRSEYWTRKTDGVGSGSGYRSGDIFTWSVTGIGVNSVDTASLAAGWQMVEICHSIPSGHHILTLTGDGSPVDIDLIIIDR